MKQKEEKKLTLAEQTWAKGQSTRNKIYLASSILAVAMMLLFCFTMAPPIAAFGCLFVLLSTVAGNLIGTRRSYLKNRSNFENDTDSSGYTTVYDRQINQQSIEIQKSPEEINKISEEVIFADIKEQEDIFAYTKPQVEIVPTTVPKTKDSEAEKRGIAFFDNLNTSPVQTENTNEVQLESK